MHLPTPSSRGLLAVYASVFLLSLNGFFAKYIQLDVFHITCLRSVVAASLIFLFLLGFKRRSLLLPMRNIGMLFVLGLLLGLHWLTYFYAMQVSTVAVGMLSLFCYPVFSAFIEPLFSKTPLLRTDVFAGLIVFAGVGVMVSEKGFESNMLLAGAGWGLFSALLFSVRNTLQKYWVQDVDSSALIFYQTLIIALLLCVFIQPQKLIELEAPSWTALILLGVFCTAGAHTLFSIGLKYLKVTSVGLISCLTPVFGSLLAWPLLGEIPSWQVITGGTIILSVAAYESYQHAK